MENWETIEGLSLRERIFWALFSIMIVLYIVFLVLFIVMGVDRVLHFLFATP